MAEKKPGLLKRIFSFGFSKEQEAAEEAPAAIDAPEARAPSEAEAPPVPLPEQAPEQVPEQVSEPQPSKAKKPTEKKAKPAAKAAPAGKKSAARAKPAKAKPAPVKPRPAEPIKAKSRPASRSTERSTQKKAPVEDITDTKAPADKTAVAPAAIPTKAVEEADTEAQIPPDKVKPAAKRIAVETADEIAPVMPANTDKRQATIKKVRTEHKPDEPEKQAKEPVGKKETVSKDKKAERATDLDQTVAVVAPQEEIDLDESVVTLTERNAKPESKPEPEAIEKRRAGWLKRLSRGLSRSSNNLKENITGVFTNKKLDDDTLQDLEDVLIQADLGVEAAMNITDALSAQKFGKETSEEEVRTVMANEIEKILDPVAVDLDLDLEHQPHVILVVGVNGSGKTTTIGKLASKLYDAGFSTTLVAGDTFRAAAIEQLKIWGERTRSPVISRAIGSDAAGLVYDAWSEAHRQGRDVLLIDTAGRLQNKTELMAELEKIIRVLKKHDPQAPQTVLLTLDATTGQNALSQVEIFRDVAGVNGLVMTKLDGTARGGILVAISAKHKLPVFFAGVGEQVADLEPFEARDFARSIAGLEIGE